MLLTPTLVFLLVALSASSAEIVDFPLQMLSPGFEQQLAQWGLVKALLGSVIISGAEERPPLSHFDLGMSQAL